MQDGCFWKGIGSDSREVDRSPSFTEDQLRFHSWTCCIILFFDDTVTGLMCDLLCTGATELPLLDYPLRQLFHLLGIQSVLDIFTGVLLEQQILFYSCGE